MVIRPSREAATDRTCRPKAARATGQILQNKRGLAIIALPGCLPELPIKVNGSSGDCSPDGAWYSVSDDSARGFRRLPGRQPVQWALRRKKGAGVRPAPFCIPKSQQQTRPVEGACPGFRSRRVRCNTAKTPTTVKDGSGTSSGEAVAETNSS